MPESVSADLAGELGDHQHPERRAQAMSEHAGRDRAISIVEALLLSIVALLTAWSGYSAAKWGTHSSLSLAKASGARSRASADQIEATQIQTLDSVSFNAVEAAYVANNARLFRIAVRRLRPGYRPAFEAWLATHPLKNPNAPPDPSDMPQYVIPQQRQAQVLTARSNAYFSEGESAAGTADRYVRLTVLLAAVLFLAGIGSRFPLRSARYGLAALAGALLLVSVVELLGLPGPP